MMEVSLTRGHKAIVDDVDYEMLIPHKWYLHTSRKSKYAATWNNGKFPNFKGLNMRMHRIILGVNDPSIIVDHINGNGLDNRRENLRLCSVQQNNWNRHSLRGGRYVGTELLPSGKYRAKIALTLGTFDTEEQAAKCYDEAIIRLRGEFACLNFPREAGGE